MTPWSAVLLAASVLLPGAVSEVEPSEEAVAAISALSAPSVPQPLPGSVALADDVYRVDGDCAAALERYQAPDAPVPPGAAVKQQGQTVVVALPYATSGVSFQAAGDSCQYTIANAPTIRVVGTVDGVPAGDGYGPVLCSEKSETTELVVATELVVDGVAAVLVLKEDAGGIVPGSFADLVTSGQEPGLPLAATVRSPGPDAFEFEITDAGGSARVTGSCTGSVFQFLGGS